MANSSSFVPGPTGGGSQRLELDDLIALQAIPYGQLVSQGDQSYRVGTVEYWWDGDLISPGVNDLPPTDKPIGQPGFWVATGLDAGPWLDIATSDGATPNSSDIAFDGGSLRLGAYGGGTFDDPNPIRLLGVSATGVVTEFDNSAPPAPGSNPVFYKAAGSVDPAGDAEEIAGAAVRRVATGRYEIGFNTPANSATYPVLATMAALPQNDDYQWAYLDRTTAGFFIEIREQDNGGSPGVSVNSGFSFFVPVI